MNKQNITRRLSVTVAIPAHNEERNIGHLLGQIINQRKRSFMLEKIILVLDGCNDNTEEIVKKFASVNHLVYVVNDGKRKGKAQRLNQIYEMNNSEILITLDGDIHLENSEIFENLLKPFIDPDVVVVGGNIRPFSGRNFFEKVIVAKDGWWYNVRKDFNKGNNIYNSAGPCFALRNDFCKSLRYLPDTINDQEIIYLHALKQNKKFFFAEKAIVRTREACNWGELIIRARRFERLENFADYGFKFDINNLYSLPHWKKFRSAFKVIFNDPLVGSTAIALAVIVKSEFLREYICPSAGLWKVSNSTKELF